jgi:hypothetical protein
MGSVLLLYIVLLDVGHRYKIPYLFLQLDPMDSMAPPHELLHSPEFGKIYKCSNILAVEPSLANSATWVLTYAYPLEILILNQLAHAHSLR